jgi:hypothetical protein
MTPHQNCVRFKFKSRLRISFRISRNEGGSSILNEIRVVNFGTSRNFIVGTTMFPHRNIRKSTRPTSDEKTQNQNGHFEIDEKQHPNIVDFRSL